jgi:hypothetical protein
MEYKAKTFFRIFFCIGYTFSIVLSIYAILKGNIFSRELRDIISFLFSISVLIILAIDGLYQVFRIIIIDENIARIKIFGKITKEEKIKTVEYNNKRYGIKKFTHMFGSVKSIIINKKYFSCITKIDNNFGEI